MDTAFMTEDVLMLRGETRHCDDCGTATVFIPVDDDGPDAAWVCTACDAAVLLPAAFSSAA